MVVHFIRPTMSSIRFCNQWQAANKEIHDANIFVNSGTWSNGGIIIGFILDYGSDIMSGRFTPDEAEEVALAILIRVKEIRDAR